jgi:glutamine---fructose-6-phosphate transaminase (isomerizing)
MCGVIGFTSEHHRSDLGAVAAELLRSLEYRGYDSTGAAIQGEGDSIVLRKGVGAPSVMVEELGITSLEGSLLCGQVRWATFGSVDALNAQPHEVRCRAHVYGAHNGNVTNCDDLKRWLAAGGHTVLSDNDGEMVVHTVEHFFAIELESRGNPSDAGERRAAMRAAIVEAGKKLEGSFAAVVTDPVSRTEWAVKQGSSLYFGFGRDVEGGGFAIASSDLSSILKFTRILLPMNEGEFVEYTASHHRIYALAARDGQPAGTPIERQPSRSRLQAKDAALLPPFESFMEQEIDAQEETARRIAALFSGGSEISQRLAPHFESWARKGSSRVDEAVARLIEELDDERILERFRELMGLEEWQNLAAALPTSLGLELSGSSGPATREALVSLESGILADLVTSSSGPEEILSVRLLDALLERQEAAEFRVAADRFIDSCRRTLSRRGRIFFVCCGSSYHAALAGAVFFNELARSEVIPILPGEFRGRFARSLRADDMVVAVSQSGETKDLIDVMNLVIASGLPIRRVAIVNNVSSTLGQEKADLVLPLRCGPEIAVPATKSYMNQLAMLYALAIELGCARLDDLELAPDERERLRSELAERRSGLASLPRLIRDTLDTTAAGVEEAARHLYLRPSMHILATRILAAAKEGALKIREVVLNHTEGYEASEFKHGPNTILGVNTLFGIDDVMRFAENRSDGFRALYQDYPLLFVTGPDETDVNLTVSQVNTHKIRGATCVMIAEENAALRQAITKAPADNPRYTAVYITLPATGDNLMVVFSATVVLQRLALRMSMLKQAHLDSIGFGDHGVHPDVPKNVSKSITVD